MTSPNKPLRLLHRHDRNLRLYISSRFANRKRRPLVANFWV